VTARLLALVGVLVGFSVALASPALAEIWGIKTHDPLSEPPSTLFRFTPDGASFTVVGIVTLEGVQVEVDGLAVAPGGDLYAYVAGNASGQLIAIDPVTAVATAVGQPLSGREIRGAAFDRDGTLVGLDAFASALVRVDAATGLPTAPDLPLTLDGQPFALPFSADLAITAGGRAILGARPLYEVDLATGALTLFLDDAEPGPDGIAPHGAGLAVPTDPLDARIVLYDVSFADDLFAYDLAPPHARTLVFGDIIPGYNAGRGDLGSWPDPGTAVGDPLPPDAPELLPAVPNPFNPRTEIVFRLARTQPAQLAVFDLRGRLVRVLRAGVLTGGEHRVSWDGTGADGRRLPSGSYLCRLATPEGAWSRALMLAK